jgi:hypothetical protein
MRESRTYGSVRGALSNERPYRDAGGRLLRRSLARRRQGFSARMLKQRRCLAGPARVGAPRRSRGREPRSPGNRARSSAGRCAL